jgi:hypothetical protein
MATQRFLLYESCSYLDLTFAGLAAGLKLSDGRVRELALPRVKVQVEVAEQFAALLILNAKLKKTTQ